MLLITLEPKLKLMLRFSLIIFLLIVGLNVQAQNPGKYKLHKISVEKGLSQSVVTGITQDSLGFMWFSTLDGVNRYDGYHFENFYNQSNNPFSLPNNFTNAILCDSNNEIWIATLNGLCRFDYQSEQFTVFRYVFRDPFSISNNEISCLALSKSGNIWIGTGGGGVNLYDRTKRSFSRYPDYSLGREKLASDEISALCEDNKGNLWVGTYNAGLDRIDTKTGILRHMKISDNPAQNKLFKYIRCIYQDPLDNIWIGSTNGLILYNYKNDNFRIFSHDPLSACSINGNIVMAITSDTEKNLWIGTEENGLNIIDLNNIEKGNEPVCFKQIRMRENEYGLSIRSILSIFRDRDQNLWVGTYSGGINFISSSTEKFQKYQHNPYDKNTIGYPKVMSLCEDKSGNIWIGTDGAGLDVLDLRTNTIHHFQNSKANPSSISDNAILCSYRDHNNNLWFGTYAGGLNRYNPATNSFTVYRPRAGDKNCLPVNDVRVIYEDKQFNLWIGTNGGGLCKYNPEKDNFIIYNPVNSKISNVDIRALLDDNQGHLIIGSYGTGLDVYHYKTGEFQNFSNQPHQAATISDNYVYALALGKEGQIWVGTGNGLNLFKLEQGTFQVFNEHQNLSNNFIHAILVDKNNDLWISTNKGISKFITLNNEFQNFDSYDGLQTGEFNDRSALYAQNGQMWFGGINGLNTFKPEDVSKSTFIPRVVINGFQLYNSPVKARTSINPDSPLLSSISTAKSVTLNHKQTVFTIDYVAFNYSFPEKTRYFIRLAGLDAEWNDVGARRSVTYRDLPPGKYNFEVKASNQDGLWTNNAATLGIIIRPPFWKTWWAYSVYYFLVALLAFLIFKYYKERIALKNKLMLEKVSHQKDIELNQERFRFFTNISHEFRTPLTLILGPVEELLEKEDQQTAMGKKLVLIYKNARKLLELINMLLDFRKVESGNMKMMAKKLNLVSFSRDLLHTFQDLASQKGISLHFNTSAEIIEAWVDREKIEIIYNNLLSNAFKFTPTGGTITLSIEEKTPGYLISGSEAIVITFRDNGIGIADKHINHIFDSYYSLEHSEGVKGTGIGLSLTKSLVEMHKGVIVVESTEKGGSSFIIELLKGNGHFSESQLMTDQSTDTNDLSFDTKKINIVSPETSAKNKLISADPESLIDKKIMLLVEDNEDVRNYIADSFSNKYFILQAQTGAEGLELANKHIPDIIISDVMMPIMDGIEFCNKIKSNISTCHIPVILLTARTSITHKKEGYETGADSYVTKPFSVDLLDARVENLLKSRKLLKSYYSRAMLLQSNTSIIENQDDKFMTRLIDLVEKNMNEPDFDVNKLANELSMSRPVLYRKIKALTDLSIIEFIRTVRMNRATQLLKTGKYRVSDVAFEVGFNDLKYFRQCFKEQFNIAPSDLIRNPEYDQSDN